MTVVLSVMEDPKRYGPIKELATGMVIKLTWKIIKI